MVWGQRVQKINETMKRVFLPLVFLLLLPATADAQDVFEDDEFFFTEAEGITVVGTAQTSQQMAVIEREEIERRGVADIVNLLHETLGLNIVRNGAYGNQAGVNLRGFDSERIAFLIDGVPVDSAMDGKFDIFQIDINSIERIEVIYGGSDSKYNVSGSFGGVVNIITVKRQEPGLRLGFSVSNTSSLPGEYRDRAGQIQNPHWEDLFDTQNYSLSLSYGDNAFSLTANVFANRAENHFIFIDSVERPRRKDNNEVWDAGASASIVWELPNFTKLIASSAFYYGDKNFPNSGFDLINFGSQQDFSSRQNFMVDAPRAFHDNLAAEASLSWQFHRRDYTSSSDAFSRHDQNRLSAVNRWNWFPADWLTLRSRIDYRYVSLDSTEIGNRSRHDGGFYLTAEFHPLEQFLLIPSAKVIFTSDRGADAAVIPKLGLLWNVTDNFAVRNNYFRSFKFPDFEDLYWTGGGGIGNPDLRPEDGWGADLGVAWRITKSMTAESVFFTQWIKDSIHWFQSGSIWRPENVGEAVLFGLDSKITFEFHVSIGPVNKIITALSYQYLSSYLLSYGYTFADSKRIPYNPEHTIGGSLDISWSSGSLLISGQYESLRYDDTANLKPLLPVFLLNAAINQRIGENFAVFCALRNILNVSYESFYNYPMPGITLTLGLRVNMEIH